MVKGCDKDVLVELVVLEKFKLVLEVGKLVWLVEFSVEEMLIVKGFFLLIIKLVLYVVNVFEDDMVNLEVFKYMDVIKEYVVGDGEVIGIVVVVEE